MDNTEGEFWVYDRITKIKQIIGQYGADNFYISFSGGKDSCVLSALIDEALLGNEIPRVYVNTGIEYNLMVQFVKKLAEQDKRIVIINPGVNIRRMLDENGYPFKSKEHSQKVKMYQSSGITPYLKKYIEHTGTFNGRYGCPENMKYTFTPEFALKVSSKCCDKLKKEPLKKWKSQNGKPWAITGLVRAEGGNRTNVACVTTSKKNGNKFHPLAVVSFDWEEWYIKSRNIKLCPLYAPPHNMERTGCKGCPYNIHLQRDLDNMAETLPAERRQCERIWKPVYAEYRRIGYRLRQQLSLDDLQFL